MARRRRKGGREVAQKGKDGKRPRHFHRGLAQGRRNDALMKRVLEPAYARAEDDQAEVQRVSAEHRSQLRDFEGLLASYDRVPARVALGPLPDPLL